MIETYTTSFERLKSVVARVKVDEETEEYGCFTVEPFRPGWGVNLGNTLRRVLLNSLEGAATTWIRLDSVYHEFTTIPHMREEVLEFLLNVKGIRIKSHTPRPGRLRLEVSGSGEVVAGDITTSANFEIVNPEHHLATLDADEAELNVEFNVEHGVGYEEMSQSPPENQPIGTMPVDAIFTPIRKVAYRTENTRVENNPNYERLILEVWTDKTIMPSDAVKRAAKMLSDEFALFVRMGEDPEESAGIIPAEIANKKVEDLNLSARTQNSLKRSNINTVGAVIQMNQKELMNIHNFGKKAYTELMGVLKGRGYIQESDDEEQDSEAS